LGEILLRSIKRLPRGENKLLLLHLAAPFPIVVVDQLVGGFVVFQAVFRAVLADKLALLLKPALDQGLVPPLPRPPIPYTVLTGELSGIGWPGRSTPATADLSCWMKASNLFRGWPGGPLTAKEPVTNQ
jgi:hypothetical protein